MTAKARASTAQDLNLPSFDKLLLLDKVSAVILSESIIVILDSYSSAGWPRKSWQVVIEHRA